MNLFYEHGHLTYETCEDKRGLMYLSVFHGVGRSLKLELEFRQRADETVKRRSNVFLSEALVWDNYSSYSELYKVQSSRR